MRIVDSHGNPTIAGAQIGDTIWVHLISGKTEKVLLCAITRIGIEGVEVDLKDRPLTFYPFTSILKANKHSDIS